MTDNNFSGNKSPDVLPPRSAASIYHLIFNAVVPGLGSLIYGRWVLFLVVAALIGGGIAMAVVFATFNKFYALIPFVLAWVVSFGGGIHYFGKDPWKP